MRVAVFSTKPYDRHFLSAASAGAHEFHFLEPRLCTETASLAHGYPAVCAFVNDRLDAPTLKQLAAGGTRYIALRAAGFNNVDLPAAARLGLQVVRVPAYSPHAVAEHALALILALNRHLPRAYNRVREGNFNLEGLLGFDLHGRTVGLIGTGQIGLALARALLGLGCRVVAHDPTPNAECAALGIPYLPLAELLPHADIVSLHCPLTPQNHHLICAATLAQMKPGAMLINTSRGGLINTHDIVAALKSRHLGYLGLDVYEEEHALFFDDHSAEIIGDDLFSRLLTFPNVIITGHQAFFTQEALERIAQTTVANLRELETTGACANAVLAK